MGRAVLILNSTVNRLKAKEWIDKAPTGSRVEFSGPRRTLDQNSKFWACLSDVAMQAELGGRKWDTDSWKAIFINALGHEMKTLPALNGSGFFPSGYSSSKLSKEEMSNLIEFILAEGTKMGVKFSDA